MKAQYQRIREEEEDDANKPERDPMQNENSLKCHDRE